LSQAWSYRDARTRILALIKRLAAAIFIALLTTSTATVNSSNAQHRETQRVTAWSAHRHVHHHRRKTVKYVNQRKVAEAKGYKKLSSLVNFPDFFPGLGVIYVTPETLPVGPFLSFDRKDRLIATIYMIPIQDINNYKEFNLAGFSGRSDHVTFYFNPGHPGVAMPHYHVVIWHVSKEDEASVAK
jgi:hypothetical protein